MKPPSLRSISRRVAAILALISFVGAALTTWGVSRIVTHEMDELLDHGLQESADLLHNVLVRAPSPEAFAAAGRVRHEYEEHLVWQVVDVPSAQVVARSMLAPLQPLHLRSEPGLFDLPAPGGLGHHWRVLTLPMEGASARLLVVAQSHDERHEARAEATALAALISALGALATTAMAYGLIRRELQRLQRLSDAVAAHDPLQPGARLPASDRQELQPIVAAVEGLGQRLAQRVTTERAFTAHAAHALRTPLAGLEVQLALAVRQAPDEPTRHRLSQSRAAAQRLARVVEALLAMFRSGLEPELVDTDLAQLAASIAMPGLGVHLEGVPVRCDPNLFAAVLMNLFDNSQRHGATQVHVTAARDADAFEVLVRDDGPGCAAESMLAMQQALDAQDYGRHGPLRGLGLILADLVLRAHGGRARLVPRGATVPPGAPEEPDRPGFTVSLRWPAALSPRFGAPPLPAAALHAAAPPCAGSGYRPPPPPARSRPG